MNVLDTNRYGYPVASSYGIDTELALLRTAFHSDWTRQRRTFLHNASLITLSWTLNIDLAQQFVAWLQALPGEEFFSCALLTGNDVNASCVVAPVDIRRVSEIVTTRIALTNLFTVSFSAETQSQEGYQTYADVAANQPPLTYPNDLPMPLAEGFTTTQGSRNYTTYNFSYRMNTRTLAKFLQFAGFAGTAFFHHPMVSANVKCGYELIRYTVPVSQTLVSPDMWSVRVTAETMPADYILENWLPPPEPDCWYDDPEQDYDDADNPYDCAGAPTPPQGNFVVPTELVVVTDSQTGLNPVTSTAMIQFMRDGSVVSIPQSVPAWSIWHTDPTTLNRPAVSFGSVVEVSRDGGSTWVFSTPVPGGVWLSLKDQDVWVRKSLTGVYDQFDSVTSTVSFESDIAPTPFTGMSGSIQLNVSIDVTNPIGPQEDTLFEDGYSYTSDPGDTGPITVGAGLAFMTDGKVYGQSGNQYLGDWYAPNQTQAGIGLWIVFTGSGNGDNQPQTGVRIPLTSIVYCTTDKSSNNAIASVLWSGTYAIFNAETGGSQVGNGSILLQSEVSP